VADRVPGRVILVGGGPGADDLITVRGLDRLMAADVVITDRLAPVTLLSRLGPEVEIIDARRAPGRPTLSYEEIADLMIARARVGKTVKRRLEVLGRHREEEPMSRSRFGWSEGYHRRLA
jgi:siroheme synthase